MKTTGIFPAGERRGEGTLGDARLKNAYIAFVEGRASREDYEFIICDLAEFSGFFAITLAEAGPEELQRAEGRREVFARFLFLADVSLAAKGELASAVRREMAITSQEGDR